MELNRISTPIKKKWGQNFLIDKNIIKKIIKIINPSSNNCILEIGPGSGAITLNLIQKVKEIHAIEIDPLLYKQLKEKEIKNLILYNEDILKWKNNHNKYDTIFGNIPYNISSQIIFKFLNSDNWGSMILMLQKELAHRIVSKHNNKEYGRISVMVQTFCDVKIKSEISKNVFHPKPKVNSSILKFKRKKTRIDIESFSYFIKQCFKQRRKKIKNNLKNIFDINILNELSEKRPEQISVKSYIKLYKKIYI